MSAEVIESNDGVVEGDAWQKIAGIRQELLLGGGKRSVDRETAKPNDNESRGISRTQTISLAVLEWMMSGHSEHGYGLLGRIREALAATKANSNEN